MSELRNNILELKFCCEQILILFDGEEDIILSGRLNTKLCSMHCFASKILAFSNKAGRVVSNKMQDEIELGIEFVNKILVKIWNYCMEVHGVLNKEHRLLAEVKSQWSIECIKLAIGSICEILECLKRSIINFKRNNSSTNQGVENCAVAVVGEYESGHILIIVRLLDEAKKIVNNLLNIESELRTTMPKCDEIIEYERYGELMRQSIIRINEQLVPRLRSSIITEPTEEDAEDSYETYGPKRREDRYILSELSDYAACNCGSRTHFRSNSKLCPWNRLRNRN